MSWMPSEWRVGWKLVLAAGLGLGAGTVHYHSMGVMIVPLEQAMGWSRSEISGGLLITSIATPFFLFIAGAVADRIGARRVGIVGLILYAFALAAIGLTGPGIVSWYVTWGLLAVVQAMASGIIWSMAVVNRFSKHRGLALGITLSGSGLVIATVPPFALWLVETWGWRYAYFGLGTLLLLIPLPFVIAFFKDAPDLARAESTAANVQTQGDARESKQGFSVPQALRGRHIWQISLSFFLFGIGVSTFLVHLQPMIIGAGITAQNAAFVASVVGPSLVIGRLVTGALLDRLSTPRVAGIVAFFPVVCCVLMLGYDGSIAIAILIAILTGVATGAEGDVLAFVVAEYLGRKNYGALYSIAGGIFGLGLGVAPTLAGMAYDTLGSYELLLQVNAVLALVAAVMLLALGRAPKFASSVPG